MTLNRFLKNQRSARCNFCMVKKTCDKHCGSCDHYKKCMEYKWDKENFGAYGVFEDWEGQETCLSCKHHRMIGKNHRCDWKKCNMGKFIFNIGGKILSWYMGFEVCRYERREKK